MRHLICAVSIVLISSAASAQNPTPKPSTSPAPKASTAPKPAASPKAAASPNAQASPRTGAHAAENAGKKTISGTLVSVDAAAHTLTFTDPKDQKLTWKVEGKAASKLATLKAGQRLKISYSVDAKGAPKAVVGIRVAPGKGKAAEAM
jgi:hypothetical protein